MSAWINSAFSTAKRWASEAAVPANPCSSISG
jgi:hypothetical protein